MKPNSKKEMAFAMPSCAAHFCRQRERVEMLTRTLALLARTLDIFEDDPGKGTVITTL
jgi:hypothetical protein